MPSIINAATSGGLISTADTSGVLQLQTASTTALSISAAQVVTVTNDASISGLTVGKGGGAVVSNTALGNLALSSTNTGVANTGVGYAALLANTSGQFNTAVGATDGVGVFAPLRFNTTGSFNTALGGGALGSNTTASNSTAVGYQAGYSTTSGSRNTYFGYVAGYSNTVQGQNTCIGGFAGYVATGAKNTYIGDGAGVNATTGTQNTYVGVDANISGGAGGAMTTGSKNTIIGGYTGNNDGLDIRTASNYAVISDGDGNRLLSMYNGGTLALDGGATPQFGTGITFPATQSASSDANCLDDYEEGTWTPTATPNSGSLTSYTSWGNYTKIGKFIYLSGAIEFTNVGTASNTLIVGGLPFTTQNAVQRPCVSSVREDQSTGVIYAAFLNGNATTGVITTLTNGGIAYTNGYRYTFSLYYLTA